MDGEVKASKTLTSLGSTFPRETGSVWYPKEVVTELEGPNCMGTQIQALLGIPTILGVLEIALHHSGLDGSSYRVLVKHHGMQAKKNT